MSACLGTMTIATAPGLRVDPPIVLDADLTARERKLAALVRARVSVVPS